MDEMLEKIRELEREKSKIQKEINRLHSLRPEIRLAEWLHEKLCIQNHTDGCGFWYESWEKPTYSRVEWFRKAVSMLRVSDEETIMNIMREYKEPSYNNPNKDVVEYIKALNMMENKNET